MIHDDQSRLVELVAGSAGIVFSFVHHDNNQKATTTPKTERELDMNTEQNNKGNQNG